MNNGDRQMTTTATLAAQARAEIWCAARTSRVTAEFALSRSKHPAVRAKYEAAVDAEVAAWAAIQTAKAEG
jgi:hypothetical protein